MGDSYQNGAGYSPVNVSEEGTSLNGNNGGKRGRNIGIGVAAVAVILGTIAFFAHPGRSSMDQAVKSTGLNVTSSGKLKLYDDMNRFVVEDFDSKPTFSDFLPGVAGYYGKPVWSFYVNRGQGIASFGTESKEYPILEFNPANKAYQLTPYIGFRTFVRGTRTLGSFETEPFSPANSRNLDNPDDETDKPKRIMYVGTNEMEVQEYDAKNGLSVAAKYFVLPEEDFASLVRRSTFTNTGATELTLSVLDGLAKIEPSGGKLDGSLKMMGRTLEGWMGVYHADDTLTMPFYKMSTEPGDDASVKIEKSGHYCLSFIESADSTPELLPIVYDSSKIFGESTGLDNPSGLIASSVGEILKNPQYGDAKTSSAFAALDKIVLSPGENITVATFFGKAEKIKQVPKIAQILTQPGYVEKKFERARSLIDELTTGVETKTANPLFDGAVKQMFLDNGLRGGIPTLLGDTEGDLNYDESPGLKVFHAFSRIHGDLERDYNAFMIEPAYFSQGPGNYRDIAQNRRNDVSLMPRIGSFDIQMFLSFIQADGYEPLTVQAAIYLIGDKSTAQPIADKVCADAKSAEVLTNVLVGGPFRPGQLFQLVELLDINVTVSEEEFLNEIIAASEDRAMAEFGQGYWADHWDYYLDMIEAYLQIYPDGEEALMYDTKLRYFFSTATVKPRSQKYVLTLTYDGKSKHVLQLDSTYYDQDKTAEQSAFVDQNTGLLGNEAYWQRTEEGETFYSSPIAKLFLLAAQKFAMRDAYGMGIEYEGGRPGWNDAMNGLPGMVGSGMPETYEAYLLLKYVKKVIKTYERPVVIPKELHKMIKSVNEALDVLEESGYQDPEDLPMDVPHDLFMYWDVVTAARENYRNDVQYYFSGNTTSVPADELVTMLGRWIEQVEIGMDRASKIGSHGDGDDGTSGISPAYFSFDITKWKLNKNKNAEGLPLVNALAMRVGRFPLFLEGPVRYMKTIQDDEDAMEDMYERVLHSGLRDEDLKMYTLSASLKGQSYDMGRMMAFTPGWLENQSIWLHMSYKYYLQLLRGKLYDKFFEEMKGGGILPFMDVDVYGRSLMECSSFIASSAFPDPSMRGRGFLARLSGSTAEFMNMWVLMFIGEKPFFVNDDGELEMQLVPAIPSWLFEDEENKGSRDHDGNLTVTFKLFSTIPVTYHNSHGGDLFGVKPKEYKIKMTDGTTQHVKSSTIPAELAIAIRKVSSVKSIDAYF